MIERWTSIAATLVALGAALAVVVVACMYFWITVPQADDLNLAVLGRGSGFVDFPVKWYFHASGRWLGVVFLCFILSRVDVLATYPVLLIGLACVYVICFYAAGRALLGGGLSRGATWLGAVVAFALLWAGTPYTGAVFYWFSGGVPYLLSATLVAPVLALLVRPAGIRRRIPRLALLVGLAAAVSGLYEINGMILCGALVFGTLFAYRAHLAQPAIRKDWVDWAIVLAGAIAGLLFSLLAPGNFARSASFEHERDVAGTLARLVADAGMVQREWILDPKLVCATLLLAVHPRLAGIQPGWKVRFNRGWKLAFTGLWLACLGASIALQRWVMADWAPDRIVSANYMVFFLGWAACAVIWTRPSRERAPLRGSAWLANLALVGLAASLLLTGNLPPALEDLMSGRAQRWSAALHERFAEAREAAASGVKQLPVDYPPRLPRMIVNMEIREDREKLRNRQVAKFFGLQRIWVRHNPVVARDDFEYVGELCANGWVAHANVKSRTIRSDGSAVTLDQGPGPAQDISITFPAFRADDTIYAAFTVELPSDQLVDPDEEGLYFVHFKGGGFSFRALTGVLAPAAGGDFVFAIHGDEEDLGSGATWPDDGVCGETYTLVIAWSAATGEARLWVNPRSKTSPSVAHTGAGRGDWIHGLALRQSDDYTGTVRIGRVSVGRSFIGVLAAVGNN